VTVASATDAALLAGAQALLDRREGAVWEGEMVWSPVITGTRVLAAWAVGEELQDADQVAAYLRHVRNDDGSWGMHEEADGNLYPTVLCALALDRLGDPSPESWKWIEKAGGTMASPIWARVWLAVLGLCPWSAIPPMPVELWLLPRALPVHPSRMYCHTRHVYQAIAVMKRRNLRFLNDEQLAPYRDRFPLHWPNWRRIQTRPEDVFERPPLVLRLGWRALDRGLAVLPDALKQRAVRVAMKQIEVDFKASNNAGLSPVSGLMQALVLSHGAPKDEAIARVRNLDYWLWKGPEGHRWVGARSTAWDTAFALQALRFADVAAPESVDALEGLQVQAEMGDGVERQYTRGGWCFSEPSPAWPVSDCTAEAVTALAAWDRPIDPQALRFILARQNPDGGFGSYERNRRSWLRGINPSELYGDCVVEISWVECTGSCVAALADALPKVTDPGLRRAVERGIRRGVQFIRRQQRRDGAWEGMWGVHMVYGTRFALHGLRSAGVPTTDPAVRRALAWLRANVHPDGGWGEDVVGCLHGESVPSRESMAVHTAWGLLASLDAGEDDASRLDAAATVLAKRQLDDGQWAPEGLEGVFFRTSALRYDMYRQYFPVMALARYRSWRLVCNRDS